MAIDPEIASGMQKLTRKSWPVTMHARPHFLSKAKRDLEALLKARKGEGMIEGLLAKLKPPKMIEARIRQAEEIVKRLEADVIVGELFPLSETEVWSVRAHFTHLGIYLHKQLMQGGETEEKKVANKAAQQTIEIIGTQAWMSKWIGYSFKRLNSLDQVEGPYWPEAVIPAEVEPQVISELFTLYHQAFTPTESELKKSVAPMSPSLN